MGGWLDGWMDSSLVQLEPVVLCEQTGSQGQVIGRRHKPSTVREEIIQPTDEGKCYLRNDGYLIYRILSHFNTICDEPC